MCILPKYETLSIEFKSDRNLLSATELTEAVVCLANAEGGQLWLGIENHGGVSGIHPSRSPEKLMGLIASHTNPPLPVQVNFINVGELVVARIDVPKAAGEICTLKGTYLRRRLKSDGTPECVPMYPSERLSRAGSLGLMDASSQIIPTATVEDLDPLERERIRQTIQIHRGDIQLLELSDEDLDGALGITQRLPDKSRIPTLAGLLLIGKEASLRRLLPSHELAFQVLEQEAVRLNEFRRYPILKALEWLETNFLPFNPEEELQVGLFRVAVPKVDMSVFRESVANALIHRDYHRLGAIHIQLKDDEMIISNPGGFVEGVTLDNILTTQPMPRNPLLADMLKRLGLAERTGRGVDTIYRGVLRFGRPAPNYGESSSTSVMLRISTDSADRDFLRIIIEEENRQNKLFSLDSLIALSALKELRHLTVNELAEHIQRDVVQARRTLEKLVEEGLIEARGRTRSCTYTLSAALYKATGQKAAYVRQADIAKRQQRQMVIEYASKWGKITRPDVVELCKLSHQQATRLLKSLTQEGSLIKHGDRKFAFYTPCSRDVKVKHHF